VAHRSDVACFICDETPCACARKTKKTAPIKKAAPRFGSNSDAPGTQRGGEWTAARPPAKRPGLAAVKRTAGTTDQPAQVKPEPPPKVVQMSVNPDDIKLREAVKTLLNAGFDVELLSSAPIEVRAAIWRHGLGNRESA
jgi:hypothetical protein